MDFYWLVFIYLLGARNVRLFDRLEFDTKISPCSSVFLSPFFFFLPKKNTYTIHERPVRESFVSKRETMMEEREKPFCLLGSLQAVDVR
jgi:hypothetical protein